MNLTRRSLAVALIGAAIPRLVGATDGLAAGAVGQGHPHHLW